jgi:mannose-1-phosphate guanylyltransferase
MDVMRDRNLWAIVLAAGDGRRLSGLTLDSRGVSVPKQYCSFGRDSSMLQWALDRTSALVPFERTLVVVASDHRCYWERQLASLPPENVIVQPRNRGTAAGILLPLLELARRDPDGVALILPSDHHVEDEAVLAGALESAALQAQRRPEDVVLLGVKPDDADAEYGYIVPGEDDDGGTASVVRFVEKPAATIAAELVLAGALWNAFMISASVRALLRLYARVPEVLAPFLARRSELSRLYENLPSRDFSRDVLERAVDRLRVLPVPPCGWSDLGTPPRLRRFVESSRSSVEVA